MCARARVCARACLPAHAAPQQYNFGQARAQAAMPAHQLILTICSAPRTGVTPHFFFLPQSPFFVSHTRQFFLNILRINALEMKEEKKKVIKSGSDSLNCYNSL